MKATPAKLFFLINTLFLAAFNAQAYVNPIGCENLECLIDRIANFALLVVLPLAVIALVFVGLKFLTSAVSGNTGGLAEARKTLLWVLVGTAIVVGASILAKAIVKFLESL